MKDLNELKGKINNYCEKGWSFKNCVTKAMNLNSYGRKHFSEEEITREVKNVFDAKDKNDPLNFNNSKIILTPLKELLAEPDVKTKYIVEELLPSGGCSIVGAKPKVGKSTFVRQLSLCVASGEPFLKRKTSKGCVIYLAFEEIRDQVRIHFKTMGATGDEELFSHIAGAPRDGLKQLTDIVKEKKPILIIIDPLFKFANIRDGNDYSIVTKALEPFINISRAMKTHLMLVHHMNKGGGTGGDGILGSTAIFGTVDTAIMLNKNEYNQERTIETTQRYGEDMPKTILCFDTATQTLSLGNEKDFDTIKKVGDEIIEYLQGQKDSVTEKDIKENISGTNAHKVKALRDLESMSLVCKVGEGKRGNPYNYSILKN
jgi:RecA-family ATPase